MDFLKIGNMRWLSILVALIGFIIASFVIFEQPIMTLLDTLIDHYSGPVYLATFIILFLTLDILLPIPSSILGIAAITAFGFVNGAVVIFLGMTLGSAFGYCLGRQSSAWILHRIMGEDEFRRAENLGRRRGSFFLVLMRAVPVLAETSVIAAGMVRMPFIRFLFVTTLANMGIALAYAYIGSIAVNENSFVLIVAGGVLIPLLAWLSIKLAQHFHLLHDKKMQTSHPTEALTAKFDVRYSYAIKFTQEVFKSGNLTLVDSLTAGGLNRYVNAMVFIDAGLLAARPSLSGEVVNYFGHYQQLNLLSQPISVAQGEASKCTEEIQRLYQLMLDHGLDRHCYTIVIGGGAVLDAVGYAAASFHRGVKTVRLPTTVLAQNDAGIGVKNGFNAFGLKNLIGSFSPPYCVINDYSMLATLSDRDKRAGIAEAVKVAVIRDDAFFAWMEDNVEKLRLFSNKEMQIMIRRCAELHLKQIVGAGDPFESGSARPLDYGHWAAHKLESITQYEVRHGEAVAIGMCLDARYAVLVGILSDSESLRLVRLLENIGFTLWHDGLTLTNEENTPVITEGLEEFRQHLGGQLCITLLRRIGVGEEVSSMNDDYILETLDWMKARAIESRRVYRSLANVVVVA